MIPYPTPPPPHIPEEQPSTGLVIRAKRQFGGFGCCPMMPPMCCPMPMVRLFRCQQVTITLGLATVTFNLSFR